MCKGRRTCHIGPRSGRDYQRHAELLHTYVVVGDKYVGVSVLKMETDKAGELCSDIGMKDLIGAVTEGYAD